MGLAIAVLAAGKGTRMRSQLTKVLHPVAGRPLITYPVAAARRLHPARLVVVVGTGQRNAVAACLNGTPIRWVVQREALGTGHAVLACAAALRGFAGHLLIIAGDVPGVRETTLKQFVDACVRADGPGGVLTVQTGSPAGYGRIVRQGERSVVRVVEERDCSLADAAIQEVNTGILCCRTDWLWQALKTVRPQNAQREYYLTDIVTTAAAQGTPLIAVRAEDPQEFVGVNSRRELAIVNRRMRQQLVERWMAAGVSFIDPDHVYCDADVTIGEDTVIGPGCVLGGTTQIGAHCRLDAGVIVTDSIVADRVHLKPYSVIEGSRIGPDSVVGPFARLRPETRLDADVRVGNFVEIKKSWLKSGVKANHLTYLGDATLGERTNVGCGTITCNYDGAKKHPTTIGPDVFIGSDTQFVAPVRIGKGATIGAGSVITDDVPAGTLAVARGRQVNVRGWKRKRK